VFNCIGCEVSCGKMIWKEAAVIFCMSSKHQRFATWIFQIRNRNANHSKTTFDHELREVVYCPFDYFTALCQLERSLTDKGNEAQAITQDKCYEI
jgi:hypothetical protein